MGDVLSFSLRSRPDPAPTMPEWRRALCDQFCDLTNWRVSRKGNPFVWVAGRPVTLFPRVGGWGWSIGRTASEGPLLSDRMFLSEGEARHAAFYALLTLVEREGGRR
jgi:hypothetical protein